MPARVIPLVIAFLLVLSGAAVSAPVAPGDSPEDASEGVVFPDRTTAEPESTDSDAQSATGPRLDYRRIAQSSAAPEDSDSTSSSQWNLWGTQEVSVAIAGEGDPKDSHHKSVAAALTYWNANHGRFTDHNITFVLDQDAKRPDVVVNFVPRIDQCGGDSDRITLACAPRYDAGESVASPTVVRVRDDRPRRALESTVKHEFGHLLGLEHGEAPMPIMAARKPLGRQEPMLNASERVNPWHESVLTVAVVQDGGYRQAALEAHVKEALAYYENDPEGWTGPSPTFHLVSDAERADIVLRVTGADACDIGGGYCWTVSGEDLDGDDSLEYYTEFEATFGGLDSRYLSWYSGRVLGYALGAESESELPRIFVEPERADERWFDSEVTRGAGSDAGRTLSDADDPQAEKG